MNTTPAPPAVPNEQPAPFDVVLFPQRSLAPRGFAIVMATVGAVSFAMGTFFLIHGAWPVFGFFGLDVALLYWAFRANYRSGRQYETVFLDCRTLRVARVDPKGRRRQWSFEPYWLRVELDDPPGRGGRLRLTSHGRSLTIGTFLPPEERAEVARALDAALRRCRCAPAPY